MGRNKALGMFPHNSGNLDDTTPHLLGGIFCIVVVPCVYYKSDMKEEPGYSLLNIVRRLCLLLHIPCIHCGI